ncbi:MAG: Spy/CpxP family protein refolding chaperone [Rhodocyclaceae bacterium]
MMSKKRLMGILVASTIGAGVAFAQPNPGTMGPGMMGGGYGPGMMGGYGQGQMGPGMMGGGYGPGMMGGGYGHGMMGQGMMGQGMMGQGMMGSQQGLPGISMDDKQRKAYNAINDDLRRKRWELMGRTMDEQARLRDLYEAEKRDPAAIGAAYQRVFDLQRQMIEATVAAHNKIEGLLTAEQRQTVREFWGQSWRGRMMGN